MDIQQSLVVPALLDQFYSNSTQQCKLGRETNVPLCRFGIGAMRFHNTMTVLQLPCDYYNPKNRMR
jgi:hypothetical protein